MNTYFIPTDPEFVEYVARAIARGRVHQDAAKAIQDIVGKDIQLESESFEKSLDAIFEKLWNGNSSLDKNQRANYIRDAIAAISAINLKLITST